MKIFGILLVIVLVISTAVFFTVHDSNKINKLYKEYKVVTTNDEFMGKITSLYTAKGASFVTLNDSVKIRFHTSKNSKYLGKNAYLDGLLSKGDTIIKKSGTDSLMVIKQKKEYYYVLGKFIDPSK